MDYEKDSRVDDYIDALPDWQQEICREVRDLVHAADPEVQETIKRTVQPYFVLEGNVCALLAAKDHVNVFVYDGAIVPDPEGIITAGHDNQTARTVGFTAGRTDQRPRPHRDVPGDHRQQPGRRLAQDQEGARTPLGTCESRHTMQLSAIGALLRSVHEGTDHDRRFP